ncbi:hypothetical protein [Actinacidiphila acididurans]|uniref:Uncharacterized protein n=1 Tax=Actinacidiphila acididurans TaxID=2784346 RepID=A0ABS2TR22_9ACTN|nr:hypothetical protein [Actinacidiphila acididurans]MBM9505794.1 hypothetical protein [Actinacidiphila acididurans]
MRYPRITGVAVCSALVATVAGGAIAATAASAETPHHSLFTAAKAAPDSRTLIEQARMLSGTSEVARPAGKLVTDALASNRSPELVTKDAAAAKEAITAAKNRLPQEASGAGRLAGHRTVGKDAVPSSRDVASDALTGLENAIDALVDAVTGEDSAGLLDAATTLVTDLVDSVVAIVLGTSLPTTMTPATPDAPAAPASPAAPDASATPSAPATPAAPSTSSTSSASSSSATSSTSAAPATPSAPATPATPATPAAPASPASPAAPAAGDTSAVAGAPAAPATPAIPASPADPGTTMSPIAVPAG